MNTDIRISVSFQGHRKRRMLRLKLGDRATDYLLDLWLATATNHPKGILEGMTPFEIALEAGYEGPLTPEEFVQALLDCKLLDPPDGKCCSYRVHDWEEHQRYAMFAPERSNKASKAAQARWAKRQEAQNGNFEDAPSNANDDPEQCLEHQNGCLEHCSMDACSSQEPCSKHCLIYDQAMPVASDSPDDPVAIEFSELWPEAPPMLGASHLDAASMLQASENHAPSNAPSPLNTERQKAVRETLFSKDIITQRETPVPDASPGERVGGKAAHDEFLRLRAYWDQHCRQEGYDTGRKEYTQCRANGDWPGQAAIEQDVAQRYATKSWKSPDFSLGLAKYLNERWWLNPAERQVGSSASGVTVGNKIAALQVLEKIKQRQA